jgi:hypothetical protein
LESQREACFMAKRGKGYRNGPITVTRRIIRLNRAYYINLPLEFIKRHRLKKGDSVPVIADAILKIVPMVEK